ncbi:MAG: Hsp20/alpha crystallin family protein [Thermoanaerobaculales bacterium]
MADFDWQAVRELVAFAARLRELVEKAALPLGATALARPAGFEPLVDVWEDDQEVIIEAELPGARSSNVELRLEGNALLLSGELPDSAEAGGTFLRVERLRGRFHRVLPLPTPVGGEPTASMREGVLRVRLPKISPPRHVAVVKEGP